MSVTFSTLFDEMVSSIVKFSRSDKLGHAQLVLQGYAYNQATTFLSQLSLEQVHGLRSCAENYISGGDSSVFTGEDYAPVSDECAAVLIMLYSHPKLRFGSEDCLLSYGLDDCCLMIPKWEQVEDNDWSWFAKEFWDHGVINEVVHRFLIRIRYQETTELDVYALFETTDRAIANEALVHCAQAYLGGQFDLDSGAFVYGSSKQYPVDVTEVDMLSFEAYKALNIRTYSSLSDIKADDYQVAYFGRQ